MAKLIVHSPPSNAPLCKTRGVEIYNFDFQSNHYHMTLGVRDTQQLADFMKRVNQQISVELRKLEGWSGPM